MLETLSIFSPSGSHEVLPLIGDTHLLKKAVGVVSTNWEGHVDNIFSTTKPHEMSSEWFDPGDKGIFSLYGIDVTGSIIFGMARYDGDYSRSEQEKEKYPHYYIQRKSATNPH